MQFLIHPKEPLFCNSEFWVLFLIGFFDFKKSKLNIKNNNIKNIIKIKIWILLIFWISSFCFISQTQPGQSSAFSLWNLLYILQPKQIPKAVSKNNKNKHKTQASIVIGFIILFITSIININIANPNHIDQANLFWGAQTYSGVWFDTKNLPKIKVGANFGFSITLIKKSSKKTIIIIFVLKKLPVIQLTRNDIIANKNIIQAPALTSLSFKTLTLYPLTSSQK